MCVASPLTPSFPVALIHIALIPCCFTKSRLTPCRTLLPPPPIPQNADDNSTPPNLLLIHRMRMITSTPPAPSRHSSFSSQRTRSASPTTRCGGGGAQVWGRRVLSTQVSCAGLATGSCVSDEGRLQRLISGWHSHMRAFLVETNFLALINVLLRAQVVPPWPTPVDAPSPLGSQVGFSAPNVRALCDVGRSTKTGGLGYIGQKGIGWKSVFRVRGRGRGIGWMQGRGGVCVCGVTLSPPYLLRSTLPIGRLF